VAKLTRESFELDSVINAAEELKYIGQPLRRRPRPPTGWVIADSPPAGEDRLTWPANDPPLANSP
jgi:hypothetical protein